MIIVSIYSTLIQIILSRSLANHLENVSHDKINRYLKVENFDDQDLWKNVKKEIVTNTEGYLIFDDTVLNKKHSNKIDLVRRQYSGNEHQVVC
ncbi:MAG: hypothetical protein F6K17_41460 [Okeania sp. SIO3C4]|nr:hypothetical protein [Okeania sp. SIO3C4]